MKNRNLIERNAPGWEVYYTEESSNIELLEDTNWDSEDKPRFIDIHNIGLQDLTLEINDNVDFKKTVPPGYSIEALEIYPYIEKVSVVASDNFILLIRK